MPLLSLVLSLFPFLKPKPVEDVVDLLVTDRRGGKGKSRIFLPVCD